MMVAMIQTFASTAASTLSPVCRARGGGEQSPRWGSKSSQQTDVAQTSDCSSMKVTKAVAYDDSARNFYGVARLYGALCSS